jgi:pilus assembly protein TadC
MTAAFALLAGAWGVLAATPVLAWSHRRAVAARLPARTESTPRPRTRRAWGPVGRVVGGLRRVRAARRTEAAVAAALPAAFDVLVAAVGSGCAPVGAVELAARWGPAPISEEFARVLVATELGGSLPDALTDLRATTPQLAPMADVLLASAELGAPATDALVRLADDARAAVRRRAETRARVLPVKLLFPLVFLVLPAFGLLTVAPALLSAFARL